MYYNRIDILLYTIFLFIASTKIKLGGHYYETEIHYHSC